MKVLRVKIVKLPMLLLVVTVLTGCVAAGPDPREEILGTWQSTVGAFPITVMYDAQTVKLAGADPVAYQLEGDRLTYAAGGEQVRIISFPGPAEMQQLDPVTGTAHKFTRVTP